MGLTAEEQRLADHRAHKANWREWGPYLSERAWGTVREDYSADGSAWDYLPHDHARSRALRWGEDGIAGICDRNQHFCFALTLWNGHDPILKERLFGLANREGNHGEDVKEYYFYLDNTPTHSYMKMLYKYPQRAYPYSDLVNENGRRGYNEPEYELLDTGVFADNRYFDVFVEYAKAGERDILVQITTINRGLEAADCAFAANAVVPQYVVMGLPRRADERHAHQTQPELDRAGRVGAGRPHRPVSRPQDPGRGQYYYKVPDNMGDRDAIVVDPMLATGNSAVAAVNRLKQTAPRSLKFVCLLTCPKGSGCFTPRTPTCRSTRPRSTSASTSTTSPSLAAQQPPWPCLSSTDSSSTPDTVRMGAVRAADPDVVQQQHRVVVAALRMFGEFAGAIEQLADARHGERAEQREFERAHHVPRELVLEHRADDLACGRRPGRGGPVGRAPVRVSPHACTVLRTS